MPRLTQDQWAAARIKWEADPTLTFEALGQELGVSRVAVSKRASNEGWERVTDLRTLAQLAHAKSDAREVTAKVTPEVTRERASARDDAVDLRADVIDRHKADLARHRTLHSDEEQAADFEAGRRAKITMEVLSLRHKAERAAYGLDEAATTQAPAGPDWTALVRQKSDAQA
jgi:transcriptional regulator with XRE-family HTH domain